MREDLPWTTIYFKISLKTDTSLQIYFFYFINREKFTVALDYFFKDSVMESGKRASRGH